MARVRLAVQVIEVAVGERALVPSTQYVCSRLDTPLPNFKLGRLQADLDCSIRYS
jgi:hypothetical protein